METRISDLINFVVHSGKPAEVEKKVSNFFHSFRKDQLDVRSINSSTAMTGHSAEVQLTVCISYVDLR
jgi:hypothetical protein